MQNLLAFIFLLICSSTFAQNKLSLQKCFEIAEANNVNIQQLKLGESFSQLDLKQSKNNLLPNINGNSNYSFNLGRTLDPTSYNLVSQSVNTISMGLNANVDLFSGFTKWNAIKSNELAINVSELETQTFRNTLHLTIFSAYLEILKAQEQINVLSEQEKITNEQYDRTKKLIDAGMLPKGDILDIEAQQAQNAVQRVNAENLVRLSLLNLQQSMNYYEDFTIVSPSINENAGTEVLAQSPQAIYTKALTNRPEIEANNLRMSIADYQLKIADGSKWPSLRFFTGASTNFAGIEVPSNFQTMTIPQTLNLNGQDYELLTEQEVPTEFGVTPFFTQLNDNLNWNMGLGLTIPIFNQFVVKNNVQRAKLNIENQKLSNRATENDLNQIIQQAYYTAKSNQSNYQANLKNINALQLAYNNIKKRYELGTANALELNVAQNNLTIAKLNMNNAKFDYIFSLKILEFYLGKPLNLD